MINLIGKMIFYCEFLTLFEIFLNFCLIVLHLFFSVLKLLSGISKIFLDLMIIFYLCYFLYFFKSFYWILDCFFSRFTTFSTDLMKIKICFYHFLKIIGHWYQKLVMLRTPCQIFQNQKRLNLILNQFNFHYLSLKFLKLIENF